MKREVVARLIALNREFYGEFADSFAQSRGSPQPGFSRLLKSLPQPCETVVDIGCGNGRFGLFLQRHLRQINYTGVDFTGPFLDIAAAALSGRYLERDISRGGYLQGQQTFDLCVCLATLQHIPHRDNRLAVVQEMAAHLARNGRIFLSNWQFAHSSRQRRKILDWRLAGLAAADVQENDYLLSWQRGGSGMRYVHLLERDEVHWLARNASLVVVDEFHSDGKEGDLNLYTVLAAGKQT